jgi:hypothetical protein
MTLLLSFLLLLQWHASESPYVTGYRVYWRTSEPSEPAFNLPFYFSADVGNVTRWENLQVENVFYYYAVTCYDAWGRESDFSNCNFVIYVR